MNWQNRQFRHEKPCQFMQSSVSTSVRFSFAFFRTAMVTRTRYKDARSRYELEYHSAAKGAPRAAVIALGFRSTGSCASVEHSIHASDETTPLRLGTVDRVSEVVDVLERVTRSRGLQLEDGTAADTAATASASLSLGTSNFLPREMPFSWKRELPA